MITSEVQDRRRTLLYRRLLVRQMVQMNTRISGLLLETGVSHNKQRLHKGEVLPTAIGRQRRARIVSRLAANTHSIFRDGSLGARDSKWMSGSAQAGTHRREAQCDLEFWQSSF